MENEPTLGQKIRMYRERAGLSQMELELEIGASPGSLSRIENGQTNPTKETILRLAKHTSLSDLELNDLLSIRLDEFVDLLKVLCSFDSNQNIETWFNTTLSSIAKILNYITIVLLVIVEDGTALSPLYISNTWTARKALEIIGGPLKNHKIVMSRHPDNAFVKAIKQKRIIEIEHVREISEGYISDNLADITQKFSKQKKAFIVPLEHNNKMLGSIYWSKYNLDNYYYEQELITTISNRLAQIVYESIKQIHANYVKK